MNSAPVASDRSRPVRFGRPSPEVLGAPADAFDAYDAAIALEYRAVPRGMFRAGRRAFLARLLATPRIYLSELFHTELDAAARGNIERALAGYG